MRRFIFGLLALLTCGQIHAADILWDEIAGGLFGDPNNWSPTQVPITGDNAIFDLNADPNGYTVTFDGEETNIRLILNTDVVTFDLGGFTYTLDSVDPSNRGVTVGDVATDVADLDLTNGILLSQEAVIGNGFGATGTVTVDVGATWTNSGNLTVGNFGTGTLTIQNGGQVDVSLTTTIGSLSTLTINGSGLTTGSFDHTAGGTFNFIDGTLTVDGGTFDQGAVDLTVDGPTTAELPTLTITGGATTANIQDVTIGNNNRGTLNITGGATVRNEYVYIGGESGSTGKVTVDGAGSTWLNHRVQRIGNYGSGTLNITGGGTVYNTVSVIGSEPNSTGVVTVDGAGSTWSNNNSLRVGSYGSGTLNITGGGGVSSTAGYIGGESGSTGVVTVDGAGSRWTNGFLHVGGGRGMGTLNITSGGVVSSSSSTYIGFGPYYDSTNVVTVNGAGSMLLMNIAIYVGHGGNGTLNITGGGGVSNGGGVIGEESGSTGKVTVDGANSTWTNSGGLFVGGTGTFVFGPGSGTLNITGGGLVSVAETLTIDYDEDGDSFINMATGGILALYGDADESLTEFLDLISGTDAIRYWDHSILDWADITGATYGDDYTLSYLTEADLNGYTVLTVGMEGDFDGDGIVDGADFLKWQRGESPNPLSQSDLAAWEANYGTVPIQPGDFDGNGVVDGHDFLQWQRGESPNPLSASDLADWEANYGAVAPLAATSTSVPEPATWIVLLIGMMTMLFRRDVVVS